MKQFSDALKDGFIHVFDTTTPEILKQLRDEQVLVDEEGYHTFSFGDHKEFELTVEPLRGENEYRICLYKNRVKITEPLHIWRVK